MRQQRQVRIREEQDQDFQAQLLLSKILESISINDIPQLTSLLGYLPLAKMDTESYNKLLNRLLEEAFKYNKREAAHKIIEVMADVDPMSDRKPLTTTIFTLQIFKAEILRFVNHISVRDHLMNLMGYSETEIQVALIRLMEVYGLQSPEVYNSVLMVMEDQIRSTKTTNPILYTHIKYLLSQTLPHVSKPSWIFALTNTGFSSLPLQSILIEKIKDKALQVIAKYQRMDEDTIIETYYGPVSSSKFVDIVSVEEAKKKTRQQLEEMNQEERRDNISQLAARIAEIELSTDPEVFQILGPTNPMLDINEMDSKSPNPCSRFGGCRMLTCYEHENIDPVSDEPYDEDLTYYHNYQDIQWFTGSCQTCNAKIASKHYAVRMPMVGGGWLGCFCSWKHAARDPRYRSELRNEMINSFELQCHQYGIVERIWDMDENVKVELRLTSTPISILRGISAGVRAGESAANPQTSELQDIEFDLEPSEIEEPDKHQQIPRIRGSVTEVRSQISPLVSTYLPPSSVKPPPAFRP